MAEPTLIQQILQMDTEAVIKELTKEEDYVAEAETNQKEYDGKHKILLKKDKVIGEDDKKQTIVVAKLVTTFQKLITNLAVAFLVGRPVKYILNSDEKTEDAFNEMKSVFDNNKMQYFDRKLARRTMIEKRAAELWYAKSPDEYDKENPISPDDPEYVASQIKVMLLSLKNGFKIYPHFDQYGDMDAFTTTYEVDAYNVAEKSIKPEARVDIYTAENIYKYKKKEGGGYEDFVPPAVNLSGKIPVVYYTQETSEWKDVQSIIERYEDLISNHADENDYFSSPMLMIKGQIVDLPDKTETGKLIQFSAVPSPDQTKTEYGDAQYLSWDNEPESLKLEGNNLRDLIYTLTSTPDVSFSSVKGISSLSGIALKLLFFDATLKAMNHQEVFGEGFMRRISIVKSIMKVVNVKNTESIDSIEATVKFVDPTPEDISENIGMLVEARGGQAVMSEETALRNNILITDVAEEQLRMEEERKKEAEALDNVAGSYNI